MADRAYIGSVRMNRRNGADLKLLWPQVWNRICRHMDGFAIGSTVAALEQRDVIDYLLNDAPVSMRQVRERFAGNAGYLHAAFRLLSCQGWLTRTGEPASNDLEFALTRSGEAMLRLAASYAGAVR